MTTLKIIYSVNPIKHIHSNPSQCAQTSMTMLDTTNHLNFTTKTSKPEETTKNGGPTMTNTPIKTTAYVTAKIIPFKHRNYNARNQLETATLNPQKILIKRGVSTSTLGMLMAQGHIPKAYGRTISRYEILRNHSLSDGPNKIQCLLSGKPRFPRKYTHIHVRDVDIQKAERIQKAWLDSVYILQSYGCKDILDSLLRMEETSNGHAMLSMNEIYNLRSALRDLTRYYGKQMAA
jgi:hypothetical protein